MELMLDLETLSTSTDAVIVQIGLVPFHMTAHGAYRTMGLSIDVCPDDGMKLGRRADWRTLRWWMGQSKEARDSLPQAGEGLRVYKACEKVVQYVRQFGEDVNIWSNGAAFDVPILEHAMSSCCVPVPWRYCNVFDVRTLKRIAPSVPRVEATVAHNALSDAIAQALWVQDMWRSLDLEA